jgi:hypothetical protein
LAVGAPEAVTVVEGIRVVAKAAARPAQRRETVRVVRTVLFVLAG